MMIVNQKYWDKSYKEHVFQRLSVKDPTIKLIKERIPIVLKDANAFEPGCFPGRFLVEVGELGYILNGCDLTPRVENDLPKWLEKQNCKVGAFNQLSYEEVLDTYKYDLVCSFGFIEHFNNYKDVFLWHCNLASDESIVFIELPNMYGFIQRLLHIFFDKDNYDNHVLNAMNLSEYIDIVPDDFEVDYMAYYGNFDFWIDDYKNRNGKVKKKLLNIFFKTKRFWKKIPSCKLWSPYAAIILKRKKI